MKTETKAAFAVTACLWYGTALMPMLLAGCVMLAIRTNQYLKNA